MKISRLDKITILIIVGLLNSTIKPLLAHKEHNHNNHHSQGIQIPDNNPQQKSPEIEKQDNELLTEINEQSETSSSDSAGEVSK